MIDIRILKTNEGIKALSEANSPQPSHLLDCYFELMEKDYQVTLEEIISLHRKNLVQFTLRLKKLSQQLHKANNSPQNVWTTVNLHFNELQTWVSSLDYTSVIPETDTLISLQQKHAYYCDNLVPNQISLPVNPNSLKRQPGDQFLHLLWKTIQKIKLNVNNRSLQFANLYLRIIRKKQLPSIITKRHFKFPVIRILYLERPAIRFMTTRLNILLRLVYNQWYEWHKMTNQLKDELLDLQNFTHKFEQTEANKEQYNIEIVTNQLQKMQKMKKQLQLFHNEFPVLFESFCHNRKNTFQQIWSIAGTLQYPSWFMLLKEKITRVNSNLRQYPAIRDAWLIQLKGERGDWLKDIEMAQFQTSIAIQCYNTIEIIRNKIDNKILPALYHVNDIVNHSVENFNKLYKEKSALRRKILLENHTLLRALGFEKLPAIIEIVSQSKINQAFMSFSERIEDLLTKTSDTHLVFKERDLVNPVPASRLDSIPFKELLTQEILVPLKAEHTKIYKNSEARLDEILHSLSEIDQIIAYNLEAALSLFDKAKQDYSVEEIKDIAVEGLERTGLQVNQLIKSFQDVTRYYDSILPQNTLEFEKKVFELSQNEKILELKIRYLRVQTLKNIRQYRSLVWKKTKFYIRKIWILFSHLLRFISRGIFRFKKITGFSASSIKIDARLANFLTQTEKNISRLPYVYQRLFSIEPLTDNRFLFEEKKVSKIMQQKMDEWSEAKAISMLLTGERGSGKTTIINYLQSEVLKNHKVYRIELKHAIFKPEDLIQILKETFAEIDVDSMEALENKIAQRTAKEIFIFENIHKLFIRTINGFDAIERFLLFLTRTQKNIFWIVTCARYGYEYLDKVINISKYFNSVLIPENKDEKDIREIILKRHRMSGYNLIFEEPIELTRSKKFKLATENEKQKIIDDYFFKKLAGLSAGNIRVAIFFWQSCIKKITKEKMIISPELNFDFSFITQLPSDILLTFAALIQHESLNEQQHALIFNQDKPDSALLLNRLLNKGYLRNSDSGFYVHPFLYRPIIKALYERNILH